MSDDDSPIERDLQRLEADLRLLESEYTLFFANRLPKPPSQRRARVDAIVRRWDRARIERLSDRFRFETLQARYMALSRLWEREMRAREEGREK